MASPSKSRQFEAPKVCYACGELYSKAFFTSHETVCNICMLDNAGEVPTILPHDPANAPPPPPPTPPTPSDDPLADVHIPDEIEIYEQGERVLMARSLLAFVQRFKPDYMAGWVHVDICRRLERFMHDVEQKKRPRLLLCMPPRHGKSTLTSNFFPAWVLGHHPEWEIIAASHTQSLALKFSGFIRDLVRDPAYTATFPSSLLNPESQSKEAWDTTRRGGYLAAGVGTGITGRGAHVLIIDDPIKDMEAADSATIRDNIWEWYASTAYTRIAPGGGVLGIMCMTGDTPVLMADGSTRRLDTLTRSDEVATYENGRLTSSVVKGLKSNGRDSILKITTNSGRIVRANQRHPFLATAPTGELKWIRARSLTTASRIVTLKAGGVSGKGLHASLTDALVRLSAVDTASLTTQRSAGLTDTVAQLMAQNPAVTPDSNTAMASQQQSTTGCSPNSMVSVPSAGSLPTPRSLSTGAGSSPLITATTQGKSEDFCASPATPESDYLALSSWHLPQPGISDFTLDEIVSIEPDGVEEVFDLSVERTENFIADGVVSHNTLWNEDDWGGRIIDISESGDGDKFEVVRYPAINEGYAEFLHPDERQIVHVPVGPDGQYEAPPEHLLLRAPGSALHPDRYDIGALRAIQKNYYARGNQRVWSALFQQKPTPEDGVYFTKSLFRYYSAAPSRRYRTVYQAWDFAITEQQTSDYTVGATILQDENDGLYVLDIKRFRSDDSIEIVDTMIDYYTQYDADLIGFEDGQIWKTMQAQWEKRCLERRVYPSWEVLKPLTDKKVRAMPLRGRMQLGKVYFPEAAEWLHECRQEMLTFPAGKHDDQVDALAWAVRLTLARAAPTLPKPSTSVRSWREKLGSYGIEGEASAMAA